MDRIKLATLVIGGILTPILISYALFPVVWETEQPSAPPLSIERTIGIGTTSVRVAVADTATKRQRGLSGARGLEQGEGMLFVFEEDGLHSFWMKDMLFSIDILWVSLDGRVVFIAPSVSPSSFPQSFTPPKAARYVVEVPAGFAAEHGIEEGSKVAF